MKCKFNSLIFIITVLSTLSFPRVLVAVPTGNTSIYNPWLNKYLGVHGNGQLVMWPTNTGEGEKWQIRNDGCIYNPWLNKYLGVHGNGQLVMWPQCSDGEKWQTDISSTETILPPETSPQVRGHNFAPIGGGKGIVTATMNRDGSLFIEGASESTTWNKATRADTFVVAIDRRGRTLFTSKLYEIPTSCGTADPTCPSKNRQNFTEEINSDLAKYVWKIDVYIGQRGDTGFQATLDRINRNIEIACKSYDDLPDNVRVAIAYKAGFTGCNP